MAEETCIKALKDAREWQMTQYSEIQERPCNFRQPRQQTLPSTVICHSDAAWRDDTKSAGLGWVFLDLDQTELSYGHFAEPFVNSPLMAEALAIRATLNQAIEKGFANLCLKSDAQDLVRAISLQEPIKDIYGLLFDIKVLASMFSSISFVFIPRLANGRADSIAKLSLRNFSHVPVL